jgi:hypothetical protein
MSKAFISGIIQSSTDTTGGAGNRAATDLIDAIVETIKKDGKFVLPNFGCENSNVHHCDLRPVPLGTVTDSLQVGRTRGYRRF